LKKKNKRERVGVRENHATSSKRTFLFASQKQTGMSALLSDKFDLTVDKLASLPIK
jgi:hypothetical protein